MFNISLEHEIKAQADAFDRGTEQKKQAEGYNTYEPENLAENFMTFRHCERVAFISHPE